MDKKSKKFLMVVVSFLLTFALLFSFITHPLKAHALSETLLLYVIASIALSLGFSVSASMVTDENVVSWFRGCLESLSAAAYEQLEKTAKAASLLYFVAVEVPTDGIQTLAGEIYSYFANNQQASNGTVFGTISPTNNDNYIGFTESTKFNLIYPNDTRCAIYTLPAGSLKVFDRVQVSDFSSPIYSKCFGTNSSSDFCNGNAWGYQLNSSDGLVYFFYALTYGYHMYNGIFTLKNQNDYQNAYYGFNNGINFEIADFSRSINLSTIDCSYWYINAFADQSGNIYCKADSYINGVHKFYFKDIHDNHIYKDLLFDSNVNLIDWFRSQCGFYTNSYGNSGAYADPSASVSFDFDLTAGNAVLQDLNSITDDTVEIVIPGTLEQLQVLAETPEAVLDMDAAAELSIPVMTADIPNINAPAALWTTKFPFCLPWDVYNLVNGFSAESDPPCFHLLVMPKDSFGVSNDDIYIDIDFEDYDNIVQILRFFISIEFILFLILITRKLTGSGGG